MAANSESHPISSNSRKKLSAFLYSDKNELVPEVSPSKLKTPLKAGHEDKENQASWVNGVVEPVDSLPGKDQTSTQTKETKPINECPKTPANRIPLADLISNAEDAFNQAPTSQCTPVDHVIWQHVPASSSSAATSQTSATRGKKRRHSSSPTSSPLTANLKGAKEPFDLQAFQAQLRTPQNDLVADLWNSYVRKSAVDGNGGLPPPRFASLLSSSPQTPASAKTNRDSSGLRRSISCNADWPTSNAKRRRIFREDANASRGIFSRSNSNILDSGESKSSKINSLLEKIERSLRKPPDDQAAGPSSSSPLPMRSDAMPSRSPSPMEGRRSSRAGERTNRIDMSEENGNDSDIIEKAPLQESSSSEFGDDDLDQDFLELAEASLDSFAEPTRLSNDTESLQMESRLHLPLKEDVPSKGPPQTCNVSNSAQSESEIPVSNLNTINENDIDDTDEFEDDYGGFSENIEEILAKYDGKLGSTEQKGPVAKDQSNSREPTSAINTPGFMANKMPPTGAEESQETTSGDEFDDDDFDLEAIEQSMSMVQSFEDGSNKVSRTKRVHFLC